MSLGPYPDFTWSVSRHRTLQACARRYYWDTYGAWGGWEDDAPAETQLAYRLSKLTNLDFALGTAIHRRAHELTEIARAGRELPSVDALRRETRRELGEIYRAGEADFVRDPKGHPMLHGFYYGDGPDEEAIERVREKLEYCLPHLRDIDLWERIREWEVRVAFAPDPDEILDPTVEVDGAGLYATPDLVLRDTEDDTLTVVDWKTGRPRERDQRQIAVYGLFVRDQFDVSECRGRIVYLMDGSSQVVDLTPAVFEETEGWIADSVAEMRRFVADPEVNRAKPKAAFPLTENRWECKGCNFFELCEEELRAEGPMPWE